MDISTPVGHAGDGPRAVPARRTARVAAATARSWMLTPLYRMIAPTPAKHPLVGPEVIARDLGELEPGARDPLVLTERETLAGQLVELDELGQPAAPLRMIAARDEDHALRPRLGRDALTPRVYSAQNHVAIRDARERSIRVLSRRLIVLITFVLLPTILVVLVRSLPPTVIVPVGDVVLAVLSYWLLLIATFGLSFRAVESILTGTRITRFKWVTLPLLAGIYGAVVVSLMSEGDGVVGIGPAALIVGMALAGSSLLLVGRVLAAAIGHIVRMQRDAEIPEDVVVVALWRVVHQLGTAEAWTRADFDGKGSGPATATFRTHPTWTNDQVFGGEGPGLATATDAVSSQTGDIDLPDGWFDLDGRAGVVAWLEEAANALEWGLRHRLASGDDQTAAWFQRELRDRAAGIRELKKWVLIPKRDTRERLRDCVLVQLSVCCARAWDALPRIEVADTPASPRTVRLIRASRALGILVSALLPWIILALPSLHLLPALPPALTQDLTPYIIWTLTSLLVVIDPNLTATLGAFKDTKTL